MGQPRAISHSRHFCAARDDLSAAEKERIEERGREQLERLRDRHSSLAATGLFDNVTFDGTLAD